MADRRSDQQEALRLLGLAYSALNAVRRLGYPLDDNWPAVADEAYESIGDWLWPDEGPTPQQRLDAIEAPTSEEPR